MSDDSEVSEEIIIQNGTPRKASVIPFQFIDVEAIESDGEGGDVDNAADYDAFLEEEESMCLLFTFCSSIKSNVITIHR